MIIYKDIVSKDELLTDTFKKVIVDDVFYKVEGKLVTETTEVSDALIGGNASAEGGAEDSADPSSISGVDVVVRHRLVGVPFKKKDYKDYIKGYVKKVIAHLESNTPERLSDFKKNVQPAVKKILDGFDDFEFYLGESLDPDAMHVLVRWEDDKPYCYFFKDGLEEEKV